MKKMRVFFSFILIFSITTLSFIPITKEITTVQAASGVYLNDSTLTLELDHYKTLRVKGTKSKASWYTSDSHVASVSSSGKVFAKAPGTATITAYVGGKRLRCKLNVVWMKENITLTPDQSYSFTIYGAKDQAAWSSNDESIVTVSDSGKITAKAAGTATITASVDGKDLNSKVSVADINHKAIVLELGGWSGFIKTLKINDISKKITWTSSDKSIATVSSDGRVRAKGAGTTTVTASVNGVKYKTSVKVLKASTKAFTLAMDETRKLDVHGTSNKITWDSNKKSVAIVSADGIVTPVSSGTASIYGFVDGRKVTIKVTVEN